MSEMEDTKKVVIIGGGASGMIAAISAAENGASVILLEKNQRLGEKLRISGGGRCNIFNAEEESRVLLSNYGKSDKFLHSAFSEFGVDETRNFFRSIDIDTKVEDRKRAFPVSNDANDVVDKLQKRMIELGVELRTECAVQDLVTTEGNIREVILTNNEVIPADSVILATGGLSRPETGSTGDGFAWLEELGHSVDEPNPNITPLALKEDWLEIVSGTSIESANIRFVLNGKVSLKVTGRLLFTHFGISGPVVLNSAYRVSELLDEGNVTALIDSLPMMSVEQLDAKLVKTFEKHRKKQLKNVLAEFTPKGLTALVVKLLKESIDFEIKTSEVSRTTRELLVSTLKGIPVTIDKLMGYEKAVVADGGIPLTEIDMRTFRSKKINNLYVTGDLLNINRPSGGYSLQLCWTSGYIAGKTS